MLQNIYSTLEHWWTCCKSLTMQKLPLLYAGCKRQAFREGSCILFCALQTAFGEHLFISHLVKCFFSASFGCFLNETFLLLLFTLSLLKQQQKKMHLDISELSEHLVVRQNETSSLLHVWKRKQQAGIVLNPLQVWTNFQNCLGGGSVTVTHCSLLPQTDSLHCKECSETLCYLPQAWDTVCPVTALQDLKWHMPSDARAVTEWPAHKAPLVWIMSW